LTHALSREHKYLLDNLFGGHNIASYCF